MVLNRFWGSVWGVVAYLFGIGLLQYVMAIAVTLFGLVTGNVAELLRNLVAAVIPIVGTLLYMDWRWNWKPAHIGVAPRPQAVAPLALGLGGGILAAAVAAFASALLQGSTLPIPALEPFNAVKLLLTLVALFAAEMVFRGVVISRYQHEMTPREVLMAAPLTPLGWLIISRFFGLGGPPTGVFSLADVPMIVALSLLYLRTDSVWLSAGLRMGVFVAYEVTTLQQGGPGHAVLWAVIAAVLLALEWFKQERTPKRVQPRNTGRGRTVRGPWGPH